ncbi:MAG: DNA polymerase III subunit delta [Eubacteriales bacterium]|nr:DNA polymerase III subunit delta [Eubacteriales bacterium]
MTKVYIFAGESYMVRHSLDDLKQSLGIQYEQMNTTEYKTMPKADELIEACAVYPFMSDMRLVAVRDCSVLTAKGSAEEAKRIEACIDGMPETTVLALCTDDMPDKRRALYKHVKQTGEIKEFSPPKQAACIDFVMSQAKRQGAAITRISAEALVAIVGCDYYALENETAKLAVYSGFKEILPAHLAACASRSLEYNVFEIHGLFLNKKASKAQILLEDILNSERPEALIGLFARKLRDMYKVRTMLDAGFGLSRITGLLGVKSFAAEMLAKECKRFSGEELRDGLKELADLDYAVKSGERDAMLALPETLIIIYKL